MRSTHSLHRTGLLLVAMLLTAATLVWAVPEQPLDLQPLGEGAIDQAPAIRISLAGQPPEPMKPDTPQESTPEPAIQPEPEPKPKPKPKPKPEPEPEPEPEVERSPVSPERELQPETAAEVAVVNVESPEKRVRKQQAVALQSAGSPSEVDNYLSRLSRHLARYYDYPRRARRLGQEGTPVIVFEFRRDGTLVRQGLRDSSGHQLLDEAALKMLALAAPLPEVPERMKGHSFSYALPVRFRLR